MQVVEPTRPSLVNVTRDEVAFRALEQAVTRIRRLETEIEKAFEELERAYESCRDQGVEMVVRLEKPTDAAWAAWKNKGYADK